MAKQNNMDNGNEQNGKTKNIKEIEVREKGLIKGLGNKVKGLGQKAWNNRGKLGAAVGGLAVFGLATMLSKGSKDTGNHEIDYDDEPIDETSSEDSEE